MEGVKVLGVVVREGEVVRVEEGKVLGTHVSWRMTLFPVSRTYSIPEFVTAMPLG